MTAIADPVAEVLGITASGPLRLIAAVQNGLPLASLDRVAHLVAPGDSKFVFQIVTRPTLARRRKAGTPSLSGTEMKLSVEEGARLTRLASVWAVAVDVWGSAEAARRFMFEPHPLLQDRKPIDVVLESELGRPVVEDILGRLKYGTAA